MTGEKRDNSGALFKAKPNENPKWPQYEGSVMVDGREFWISAWIKEGKSGKFFSLAFKPKPSAKSRETPPQTTKRADLDEDINW